ncbi:MAG: ABC transporter substrate-binding protein [Defluviitaleaceae bacterium]|nr:ABC transporter substrate-binding protein [Defluviitaleaceae bacterium]
MKQMKKCIIVLLGLLIMAIALTACTNGNEPTVAPEPAPEQPAATPEPTPEAPEPTPEPELPPAERTRPTTDREGYAITLPDEINTILAIGPSNAEILVAMGLSHKIIAVDMFTADVPGLASGISTELSIVGIDTEYVIELMPDLVLITGMARVGGEDPLQAVSAAGISIIYMPSSTSIQAIMEDIRFIAAVMETYEEGEAIISAMQAEIDEITAIAATITQARTVYFEISPAIFGMFSFGHGTFLHEMIELTGAVNIFEDQHSWIPVSEEALLEANPDVILTSVDFIDDPIAEIMERPGFDTITAVQNGHVFTIDANSSNRPSQNITKALREIAQAVFPEYFQ